MSPSKLRTPNLTDLRLRLEEELAEKPAESPPFAGTTFIDDPYRRGRADLAKELLRLFH